MGSAAPDDEAPLLEPVDDAGHVRGVAVERARVKARMEEPPEALKRLSAEEQATLRDLLLKAMRG